MTSEISTREVDDIRSSADNFAISLWGDTLYANPDYHVGGRVLSLSEVIITLVGSPWPSIWYSFLLFLKLVTPGEPTRSEAKLRANVADVINESIENLKDYEQKNQDAPLKTIRNVSVMTGGGLTGPLSSFAIELANLNVFGSFSRIL